MTLQLRHFTPEVLTFSDGQTLRWADVRHVTWLGNTEQWILQTQAQKWRFKRPFGYLGVRLDAAIYALPHSQSFWGSTATARIPAEVAVWHGKNAQPEPQRERQMLRAQFTDWFLVVSQWVCLLSGAWLMWRRQGFGLLLGMCLLVLVQMLRYRLDSLFLNYEERHVSGLTLHPDILTLTHSTGESELLPLEGLRAVRILTNDSGPFGNDLYFMLEGNWGVRAIPGDLDDCQQLFDLFDRLPGFDHEQSVQAMGSTSNAVFDVWHAPEKGSAV